MNLFFNIIIQNVSNIEMDSENHWTVHLVDLIDLYQPNIW